MSLILSQIVDCSFLKKPYTHDARAALTDCCVSSCTSSSVPARRIVAIHARTHPRVLPRWSNTTRRSGACGACKAGNCISGQLCATPEPDCQCATSCQGALCRNCNVLVDQCSLSIYVAFLGNDKNKSPLKTGAELNKVRSYSVSAGLTDTVNTGGSQLEGLQSSAAANIG